MIANLKKTSVILIVIFSMVNYSCERIFNDSKGSLRKIFSLPDELAESSGMIIYDSVLWSFNDSDNSPILYGVSLSNGELKKIINLPDAENIDWEDITQDEEKIFIGDIGNISGDRDSLILYILNKSDINSEYEQNCSFQKTRFVFEDQMNFSTAYHATQFDCEAIIAVEDSIYIFTKNWVNLSSSLYSLPKIPGAYAAKRLSTFKSDGLITGAGYNEQKNEVALCGYNTNYVPFVILIDVESGWNISDNMINHFDLYDHLGYQIEGIDYHDQHIYLTCENSAIPQAFLEFIEN
jgi:hypothetical protein